MDRHITVPSDNKGVVVIVFTVPKNGADAMPAEGCFSIFPRFSQKPPKNACP